MKARRSSRLARVGLIVGVAAFFLAPALPAQASHVSLAVSKAGNGNGSVTGTGIGFPATSLGTIINCGSDCSEVGLSGGLLGDLVTLTATPGPFSSFGGWTVTGDVDGVTGCGISTSCSFILADLGSLPDTVNVVATFLGPGLGPFPHGIADLQVNKAGTGSGTVTSSNIGGINCGTDCFERYGWTTGLTLTATPDPGSSFAGWNVAGGATNIVQNGNQVSLNLNWPYWDWNTWPWNFNNFNYSTLVTATFNTATATVATAAASTFTHLHQHGGIVTGRVHHGVYHAKKHVHAHTHAL
jgi:hypothetical protein